MVTIKKGNIFTTHAQTIVNTVNCVGVMGAGIAFEFRLRYPQMYQKYQELCFAKQISIGKLWIYPANDRLILNFPTKQDWKFPSKKEYLHLGLQKFVQTYASKNISSVAFPLLGADKGGIDPNESLSIMQHYLEQCNCDVEIWQFDPFAEDDLYASFKTLFSKVDDLTLKNESGIKPHIIRKIRDAIECENIHSISGILRIKGVGEVSLEKLFHYVIHASKHPQSLFDFDEPSVLNSSQILDTISDENS